MPDLMPSRSKAAAGEAARARQALNANVQYLRSTFIDAWAYSRPWRIYFAMQFETN